MPDIGQFRIVCLGGSAGGLKAYLEILRGLPSRSGMAFVIVSHRGLDHPHLLQQLLVSATGMPVIEAEEQMPIAPNCVFLTPPEKFMTTDGRVLHLEPRLPGRSISIDLFLYSLAAAIGRRAVAVILSGMDSDGSAALGAIKRAGGVTFAQLNPAYESMPRHAFETGHIDFVLSPPAIARALLGLKV